MTYTIKTYNPSTEYINFEDDIPSLKRLLERFNSCKCSCLDLYEEATPTISLSVLPYGEGYIGVEIYKKTNGLFLSSILEYSMVLHNGELETATHHADSLDFTTSHLVYRGNNLHGTQLVRFNGQLYSVNMNHGRIEGMFKYSGGLFFFGTRLEEIKINPYVLEEMQKLDRKIRKLLK